ncbi:MAG: hypothetical protein JSV91_04315 [Phycisphaerales bacterium]|nr:MAG: hypothetical protein JSV91_04315 [Phycisphaerales bacterium]
MNAMPSQLTSLPPTAGGTRPDRLPLRRAGFSITELLVVIGVIVLLVALLLVALDTVQDRANRVKTQTQMEGFARACDAFQIDQGSYPGVIPEEVLASDPQISGTENALLHLTGGFRVLAPTDPGTQAEVEYNAFVSAGVDSEYVWTVANGREWRLAVRIGEIGEGPVIDGQPHTAYYTPGAGELGITNGQWPPFGVQAPLPDLIDAWGQPIGYIRQVRTQGPLTLDPNDNRQPQFRGEGLNPYVKSEGLGEYGMNQTDSNGNLDYSIFHGTQDPNETLAQIIRHPAMGVWGNPGDAFGGSPRGAYYLFSPGVDGVFFSVWDGPGSSSAPEDNILQFSPKVVEEYDDVVVAGGG